MLTQEKHFSDMLQKQSLYGVKQYFQSSIMYAFFKTKYKP